MLVGLLCFPKAARSDCTTDACTSPDGTGGHDCWAGVLGEPCTCSDSRSARLTGTTASRDSNSYNRRRRGSRTYYQYTCCTAGANYGGEQNVGEQCGDHSTAAVILSAVVPLLFLCVIICWCQRMRRKRFEQNQIVPVIGHQQQVMYMQPQPGGGQQQVMVVAQQQGVPVVQGHSGPIMQQYVAHHHQQQQQQQQQQHAVVHQGQMARRPHEGSGPVAVATALPVATAPVVGMVAPARY